MKKVFIPNEHSIKEIILPENELEASLIAVAEFKEGLLWGKPRFGHPEGQVVVHVRDVFDNIDKLGVDEHTRQKLRLVALVHDTFKFKEVQYSYPREPHQHHAYLARVFLENYIDDSMLLDIVELHDEAYYSWRAIHMENKEAIGQKRLKRLLDKVGDGIQFYYLFFKCDTRTGDKNQAPLRWFERTIEGITIIDF